MRPPLVLVSVVAVAAICIVLAMLGFLRGPGVARPSNSSNVATRIARPIGVPRSVLLVESSISIGDPDTNAPATPAQARVLYAVACEGDVVVVTTTRETLYAEVACGRLPSITTLLGQTVRLAVDVTPPASLHLAAAAGVPDLNVGRVWIETR